MYRALSYCDRLDLSDLAKTLYARAKREEVHFPRTILFLRNKLYYHTCFDYDKVSAMKKLFCTRLQTHVLSFSVQASHDRRFTKEFSDESVSLRTIISIINYQKCTKVIGHALNRLKSKIILAPVLNFWILMNSLL